MAEKTAIANRSTRYAPTLASRDGEFSTVGVGLTDELGTFIYEIYFKLMFDAIEADKGVQKSDLFSAYLNGFYVPVSPRIVLSGQVDLQNFAPPERMDVCAISDYRGKGIVTKRKPISMDAATREEIDVGFYSIRKVATLPKGVVCVGKASTFYKAILRLPPEREGRKKGTVPLYTYYIGMAADGVTYPCFNMRNRDISNSLDSGLMYGVAWDITRCINAVDESRYLWRVETTESVVSERFKTPLSLGVDAEHVKSLFYARSAPTTETGRRRPILHWVDAHLRRLKNGTEVDISKHLRGITEFEMDGLPFRITSPIKNT